MSETHHHDYAAANAKHFSEQSASYRTELSLELAKRCAGVIASKYSFDSQATEVLDFACGPGLVAYELLPNAKRIVGADSAQGMVKVFNEQATQQGIPEDRFHCVYVDRLKGDASDLDGALFDVVICVQSYHHFEDPLEMTRALAQHLKPKGRLIVIDFLDDEGIKTLFGHHHGHSHGHIVAHKHGFSPKQLTDLFQSAGLQHVQVENAFEITKSEMKSFKGHEVFGHAMSSDADFTLKYLVAYGDKP